MSRLQAWTDGGCRGNPGVGGWAFLVVDSQTGKALERCGGEQKTTNNRMEMMGAIMCLRSLRKPGSEICIHSDSKYLIDCCSSWMAGWKRNGWKRNGWKRKGGELKNVDLLKELDQLLQQHQVSWKWVKGHAGEAGNEHVDALLNEAMDRIQAGESGDHDARLTWSL